VAGTAGPATPLTHPRMIFVNSMSDLFHERVSASYIDLVLDTIRATARHTYQVPTKRPGRMAAVMRQLRPPRALLGPQLPAE
jgi:protein gp37